MALYPAARPPAVPGLLPAAGPNPPGLRCRQGFFWRPPLRLPIAHGPPEAFGGAGGAGASPFPQGVRPAVSPLLQPGYGLHPGAALRSGVAPTGGRLVPCGGEHGVPNPETAAPLPRREGVDTHGPPVRVQIRGLAFLIPPWPLQRVSPPPARAWAGPGAPSPPPPGRWGAAPRS